MSTTASSSFPILAKKERQHTFAPPMTGHGVITKGLSQSKVTIASQRNGPQ
ncbi:hypothetical protein C4K40_0362 [Pseudomonas sp. CMR5c]|nr:hypothetical protein C4K40_0362 [Pseudomonas sp. CMR5c]